MNLWWSIPGSFQYLLIALFAAGVAGQVTRGIDTLAWNPRRQGPWCEPPSGAACRRWWARMPIVGWLSLRGESPLQGRGHWIRPFCIEIALTIGAVALYHWETAGRLLTFVPPTLLPVERQMLGVFCLHALLFALLTVATFIDWDEQTVPDEITFPGTVLGLLLAIVLPYASLPVLEQLQPSSEVTIECLRLTSPLPWWEPLDGWLGWSLGCTAILAWCWALLPKTWTLRGGWRKAFCFLLASISRSGWLRRISWLAWSGISVVSLVWWWGGPSWQSLLSALAGLVVGGGIIWSVRVIGSLFLREEAMGFGDVTLLGMIGVYLGWQASLVVFFISPLIALTFAVLKWLFSGQRAIAYGPYLCLATLLLVLRWPEFWERYTRPVLELLFHGWEVPLILAALALLFGPLLWSVRKLRELLLD